MVEQDAYCIDVLLRLLQPPKRLSRWPCHCSTSTCPTASTTPHGRAVSWPKKISEASAAIARLVRS